MSFMESQNNLIWKGSLEVISSNPLLKVGLTSGQVGSISKKRDSTGSLGNWFHCKIIHTVKKPSFLIFLSLFQQLPA